MIYENICTKKEYEVNGVKKTVWLNCGTLRTNDAGKKFIELNQSPDVTLFVFPKKDKESKPEQTTEQEWLDQDNS